MQPARDDYGPHAPGATPRAGFSSNRGGVDDLLRAIERRVALQVG